MSGSSAVVFLCGFMGVGKSTVGRALAERRSCDFCDCDEKIVAESGKSIPDIFSAEGETGFRRLEAMTLKNLCRQFENKRAVISLGGGVLNSPENLELILQSGTLVYLSASEQTLLARLADTADSRPLLGGLSSGGRAEKISMMMKERAPLYQRASFEIATDGLTPEQVADRVLQALTEASA